MEKNEINNPILEKSIQIDKFDKYFSVKLKSQFEKFSESNNDDLINLINIF